MRRLIYLVLLAGIFPEMLSSQKTYVLSGQVKDEHGLSLPGASVILNPGEIGAVTDTNGVFNVSGLNEINYELEISFLGYDCFIDTVNPAETKVVDAVLKIALQNLREVVVHDHYIENRIKEDSRSIEVVDREYLKRNLSGSLMKSLERLPGVSSVGIGSGSSKPVIRGLGFNRVVVSENGIKHEAQQWGADHGLEIDQYSVGRIEVIKGPASLMYGSDAIAGLISLEQHETPAANSIGGKIDLTAKSNNKSLGGSVLLFGRKNRLFLTTRLTGIKYADFKVPEDTLYLYSYKVPLENRRVRNTAGEELNLHFTAGYIAKQYSGRIFLSSYTAKSGFFANAAGLHPLRADSSHDHSDRDILLPYQDVRHLKVINRNTLHLNNFKLESELGYQNNLRQEWMNYSPEGPDMPNTFPDTLPFSSTLEKEFRKSVLSGIFKVNYNLSQRFLFILGIDAEYQENDINGRSFLIPAYDKLAFGNFIYSRFEVSGSSFFNAGIRFDHGKLNTENYNDWYPPYTKRAFELNRSFTSFSWSTGYNLNTKHLFFKANAGKSFRIPLAKELAANGTNYHLFRVEIGDSTLAAEESYQLDIGIEWQQKTFAIGINPFVNYFPNYIFLSPTSEVDEATNKQIFRYKQAEVFRYGGEIHAHYSILRSLKLGIIGEYVYSEQLSGSKQGSTLPFSPPASLLLNVNWSPEIKKRFSSTFISVDYKLVNKQINIVPPEESTPGYRIVNVSMGTQLKYWDRKLTLNFQVQNLFNRKYYNHTSYYRLINMPEPGRNIVLNISIPINKE